MITLHTNDRAAPPVTLDRLGASLDALAGCATATGRDTAADLLRGILRELRAAGPAPT